MGPLVIVASFLGAVLYIVLCAVIAVKAAETNRSGGGYFFLSFFLSPFLGFMVLSLSMLANIEIAQGILTNRSSPKLDLDTASRMSRTDITWECPNCQHENPNDSFECKNCGQSLK